ncbi:MAG: hypothetical protein WA958_12755 [Tunicatimonas sp.]
MMNPRRRYRGLFFLFVPLLIATLGAVVMMLWNAILPEVVGAKPLSYGQALGLLLLSRILFGGFRFGGGGPPWKGRRRGRWTNLSEEDRTRMKEAWRQRCKRS